MALATLLHVSGFGLLRGTVRIRLGIALHVGERGSISALSLFVAPHELLLGQGPRSVGEPWCEARQFHGPGGPPQIVTYAVLVLRGNGVGIKNHILDVGL